MRNENLILSWNDIQDWEIEKLLDETVILRQVRDDTRQTGSLGEDSKQRLLDAFQKRFNQAMELVDDEKVSKYVFSPSGRTIWVVAGKHGEYQVLPESMFCSCDDYFYRVMSGKKQVCYHIIAQQIAEALGKYRTTDLADSSYAQITSKWTPPPLQS
jgi:predicted nucleic acid-binding Zn finger protein